MGVFYQTIREVHKQTIRRLHCLRKTHANPYFTSTITAQLINKTKERWQSNSTSEFAETFCKSSLGGFVSCDQCQKQIPASSLKFENPPSRASQPYVVASCYLVHLPLDDRTLLVANGAQIQFCFNFSIVIPPKAHARRSKKLMSGSPRVSC